MSLFDLFRHDPPKPKEAVENFSLEEPTYELWPDIVEDGVYHLVPTAKALWWTDDPYFEWPPIEE